MSSDPPTSSDFPAYGHLPEPADTPPGSVGSPASDSPAEAPTAASAPPGDRPPGRDWRFLISPRWLGWHALVIVLVTAMLALGDWQFRRAEAGNALSWAYTFEWPIFAGFAVVFWAKTIRDEFHPPTRPEWTQSKDELPGGARAPGSGPGADGDEDEDEELAEYNAYLARLTAEARGHGKWHGLR